MSESVNQPNKSNSGEEIDIFEFFSRIWKAFKNFLKSIGDFFVICIIFLIRKSLWIVSFALLGLIIGYTWHSFTRSYYSSSLEGNTMDLNNTVVIDHINKLNFLTDKPALLGSYLGMEGEDAKSIRSIKAYYGIDVNKDYLPDYIDFKETYNPKDTNQIRVPSYIYIEVTVYDETILQPLREGLFKYVGSNAYIQELYKIGKDQKRQMIRELDTEIAKIDTLQRFRYRKESRTDNGQLVIMGNEPDYKLFYEDLLDLYARKQRMERDLELSNDIIVIVQDFTPLEKEENPRLKYMIVFGCIMAVIGLFVSLIWQYRKKIWTLIREDASGR